MCEPSLDEALRLMPATLASEVRAAGSANITANQPLPSEDYDLTAGLSINSPSDIEFFLDTEYIQLPDPTLELSHDDQHSHDPNSDHIPRGFQPSAMQNEEGFELSNISPPYQTASQDVGKGQPAIQPKSILSPDAPVSSLIPLPTSPAPTAHTAKQSKARGAQRPRTGAGPLKRPRARNVQGSVGHTFIGGSPVRIAPRGTSPAVSTAASVKDETVLKSCGQLCDNEQRQDISGSDILASMRHPKEQPQVQPPSKSTTLNVGLSSPIRSASFNQIPIPLSPNTSNLIPVVPNLYPMGPIMFPPQPSPSPHHCMTTIPSNQALQEARRRLTPDDINGGFLQQHSAQMFPVPRFLQNESQLHGPLSQLNTPLISSSTNETNAATASVVAQFVHHQKAAAAATAIPDATRNVIQTHATGVKSSTSGGATSAAMPHALHIPNFTEMGVPTPTPPVQLNSTAAVTAVEAVAALQSQGTTITSGLLKNQRSQQQRSAITNKPQPQPNSHLRLQQQHGTQVSSSVVPMHPIMFDPTNIYYQMAAQQLALQMPTTVNGQFIAMGSIATNSSVPTTTGLSDVLLNSNLQSPRQNVIQNPKVSSDALTRQQNIMVSPETSHVPGTHQHHQHHQREHLATIVTDGVQRNFPKQPAARLDRHPILGRLQLNSSSKSTAQDTTAATNISKPNGMPVHSSSSDGIDSVSRQASTDKLAKQTEFIANENSKHYPKPIRFSSTNLNNSAEGIINNASSISKGCTPSKTTGLVNSKAGSSNAGGSGDATRKSESRMQKKRLVWTPELHERFVTAIEEVGIGQAVPKTLVMIMNVEGLTTEHVKSHLQKYRNSLRKEAEEEAKERAEAFASSKSKNEYILPNSNALAVKVNSSVSTTSLPVNSGALAISPAANTNPIVNSTKNLNSTMKTVPVASVGTLKQQSCEKFPQDEILSSNPAQVPAAETAEENSFNPIVPDPGLTTVSTPPLASISNDKASYHTTRNRHVNSIPSSAALQSTSEAMLTKPHQDNIKQTTPHSTIHLSPTPSYTKPSTLPTLSKVSVAAPVIMPSQLLSIEVTKTTPGSDITQAGTSVLAIAETDGLRANINMLTNNKMPSEDVEQERDEEQEMAEEQRELELELMKEKTLQMQLQLQKMVHRTVALDRKYQQECQMRQREQAMEREGSSRSGRSNPGLAKAKHSSNKGILDTKNAEIKDDKGSETIQSKRIAESAINVIGESASENAQQKGIKNAEMKSETSKRRRLMECIDTDMSKRTGEVGDESTRINLDASTSAMKTDDGETEYEKLIRQQLIIREELEAHQVRLNHIGKPTRSSIRDESTANMNTPLMSSSGPASVVTSTAPDPNLAPERRAMGGVGKQIKGYR